MMGFWHSFDTVALFAPKTGTSSGVLFEEVI